MKTYKFRITSEINEDFLIDVEIKANQTFLEFHNSIKSFCNIKSDEIASFYICDDKWRKKKEITLFDMNFENENKSKDVLPILIMEKVKINQVIDDPHQKFLYIYDFINMYMFYVELMQIQEASEKKQYPLLLRKEGDLNFKQTINIAEPIIGDEDFNEVFDENAEKSFLENDSFSEDNEDAENIETQMYFNDSEEI